MPIKTEIKKIKSLLPRAMVKDRVITARKLENLRNPSRQLPALKKKVYNSIKKRENRDNNIPRISYPKELPITSRRADIVSAIKKNQVVIISGETGSGKSTQIPKMCLEAGGGLSGMIGCTQPRRIAASTISRRIAEELGEPLGKSVGYKIRFKDMTPASAYIKIMTDGILLAETRGDRGLYEYDTLIIDEAHERSLNIDFLLGILRTLLPERPELKVIITSATMDTARFSDAFGNAPVVEISGRLFPVDVEYEPLDPDLEEKGDITYVDMAVKSVDKLHKKDRSGDILIFMPTEQDILETCDRLKGRDYKNTTVLPLFARLPAAQQGRVYSVKGNKIVVATNVAETSLTIPNIKYVIDTGLARISRYLPSTRTNSLPVSSISRSSAEQRKGRCGRVRNGVCIRLYSKDDFENRPEFTPPEIIRSNLAEVILRMVDLKLGDPKNFPFIDPPNHRSVKDGFDLLEELGAIKKTRDKITLTEKGRLMAQMPLDPRISRMMIEAKKEDITDDIAVIAGAMSIQDPRERPLEKVAQADQMHAPFKDKDSDFITLLNIWNRYHREWRKLKTQNRMRRFCKKHFLSFNRMREWLYTYDQIMNIIGQHKTGPESQSAGQEGSDSYLKIHRSILSGFLSNIAVLKENNIYQAARGREVMIFPGSTLFNRKKEWIVAAEMVKTSRLFARTVARIDPSWLESLGGELCKISYDNPHWEKNRGEVRAHEKVTLYGLTIISGRPVSYGRIDPNKSHKIFIQSALVEGDIKPHFPFLKHNQALLDRLRTMEHKLRRRELIIGEEALAFFYSERLEGICDSRSLGRLIKEKGGDGFLRMTEEDLLLAMPGRDELDMFPDEFRIGDSRFKISYRFLPGDETDGITIKIPASVASRLPADPLEKGVKGQIRDKITAFIKGLPKRYRKQLVPVSDTVDIIMKEMKHDNQPLITSLSRFVYNRFGADIPADIWDDVVLPDHLRTRVSIIDHDGKELQSGRNIPGLLKGHKGKSPDSDLWKKLRSEWEQKGLSDWEFNELPEEIPMGWNMTAYPGLEVDGDLVNIRIFPDGNQALESHLRGVRRLLAIRLAGDLKFLKRKWPFPREAAKGALYFGGEAAVEKLMVESIVKRLFQKNIRKREDFEKHAQLLTGEMLEKYRELREYSMNILKTYDHTRSRINDIEESNPSNQAVRDVCTGIRQEMEKLIPADFPELYEPERLAILPRYLRAMEIRAERGSNNPDKDKIKVGQIEEFVHILKEMEENLSDNASNEKKEGIEDFRWMVEEFKVSVFAQELGTAFPISKKRLKKRAEELKRMF